jgi:hypothetical protein
VHKPTLKMKELREVRDGLAKQRFSQSISRVICFILLQVGSFDVVQRVGGDLKCMVVMLERSSPHLLLSLLLFNREK